MNWKATVVIVCGIFAILAIVGAIYFVSQRSGSDIEIIEIENTTRMENSESTTQAFRAGDILDAPPNPCDKGHRYDDVSMKCKRIIRQAVPK